MRHAQHRPTTAVALWLAAALAGMACGGGAGGAATPEAPGAARLAVSGSLEAEYPTVERGTQVRRETDYSPVVLRLRLAGGPEATPRATLYLDLASDLADGELRLEGDEVRGQFHLLSADLTGSSPTFNVRSGVVEAVVDGDRVSGSARVTGERRGGSRSDASNVSLEVEFRDIPIRRDE